MATTIMQPMITIAGGQSQDVTQPKYSVMDMRGLENSTITVRVYSTAQTAAGEAPAIVLDTADLNENAFFVKQLTGYPTTGGSTIIKFSSVGVHVIDSWAGDFPRDASTATPPTSNEGPRRMGRYLRWRCEAPTDIGANQMWSITFEIIVTRRGR